MTFSAGFMELLIYGALILCALSALSLGVMLLRDIMKGESW